MIPQNRTDGLKSLIGKKVRLTISENWQDFYKCPNEITKKDHEFDIKLQGIYGISRTPLYLLGSDVNGEVVFRNDHQELRDDENDVGIEYLIDCEMIGINNMSILKIFPNASEFLSALPQDSYNSILIGTFEEVGTDMNKVWETRYSSRSESVIKAVKSLDRIV